MNHETGELLMIRILTSGESHGNTLTGIMEGMPSGLSIEGKYLDHHLARRQKGYGRSERMRKPDTAEITSGLYKGKTTGSPVTCIIKNQSGNDGLKDARFGSEVFIPRPGHADYAGAEKYRLNDLRPVMERASARETAMRVALGSIARRLLEEFGICIASHVLQVGPVRISPDAAGANLAPADILDRTEHSEMNVIDPEAEKEMIAMIKKTGKEGDSLGGIIELVADGLPAGIGSYQHPDRRLPGLIMQAVGSVPGAKGVEIGDGFLFAGQKGSGSQDEFLIRNGQVTRITNHCGGIEGGMTTGQTLILRAVMKPIPTIQKRLKSFDIRSLASAEAHYERADVCAVPAFGVIAESMLALALVNPFLEKFGGDSVSEIMDSFKRNVR